MISRVYVASKMILLMAMGQMSFGSAFPLLHLFPFTLVGIHTMYRVFIYGYPQTFRI